MFWRSEEEPRHSVGSIAETRGKAGSGDEVGDMGNAPEHAKEGSSQALRRTRYRYVGQVQGVGFRWTSQRIARALGLTGWVRNEYDGSVTLVLQGTSDQIGAFATQLSQMLAHYARYTVEDREDLPVDSDERDFRVRY